jgi:hypothetical protein
LLGLRRSLAQHSSSPASRNRLDAQQAFSVHPARSNGIILKRSGPYECLLAVALLEPAGPSATEIEVGEDLLKRGSWEHVLGTEDTRFCSDPQPPVIETRGSAHVFRFSRPGAVVLRVTRA